MSIFLHTPDRDEVKRLLMDERQIRGGTIADGALPSKFLLEEAVKDDASPWVMPRLFVYEESAEVIGAGGYKSRPVGQKIEVKYGLAPKWRNKGQATACLRALLIEAFQSEEVEEVEEVEEAEE